MAVRNKPMGRIPVQVIDELWKGCIDMHIHPGPDPNAERPIDSAQVATLAEKAGMKAVVLKSFSYNTASDAYIIQKNMTPDLHVFGSVVIGYTTTGGLRYAARTIEAAAKIGCKVVWFPAMDAEWCQSYLGRPGTGITILKEDGTLKDEVYDILKVIKQYNMVVCSGHMSYEESTELITSATVKHVYPDGVDYEKDGKLVHLDGFDCVVAAFGFRSWNPLEEELKDFGGKLVTLGDADKASNGLDAIYHGTMLGLEL